MERPPSNNSGALSLQRRRRAASILEVTVALSLLVSVLSMSVSLIFRHARLLTDQRHYRQALDELSNQMDRLTALPADDVAQVLTQLSPSEFAAARLTAVKLSADLKPADGGQRLTLRLTWNDGNEQAIAMTGWVFSRLLVTGEPDQP
jgi:hypothetical protein